MNMFPYTLIGRFLAGDPKDRSSTVEHEEIAYSFDEKFKACAMLSSVEREYFRLHLPYRIIQMQASSDEYRQWQFLNRKYHSLGLRAGVIETPRTVSLPCDPEDMEDVWSGDCVGYLYNDNSESLRDYFDRLGLLLSLADWSPCLS